ncbi:MAG: hypothetical protein M5U35_07010 [Roseovarius sp.]|nr:hypothetical protein [Roseovarius sp.]
MPSERAYIRQSAKIIGIDESYLSRMVDEFYDRVRADARLGPIFGGRPSARTGGRICAR